MAFFINDIATEGTLVDLPTTDEVMECSDGIADAFHQDFIEESYLIEASMYVADSMIERAVFEGYSDADVVVENALTTAIDKVKTAIQTLWKKIVAFINGAKDNIRRFLMVNTKFVAKHKDEIVKKFAKLEKFETKGYKFDQSIQEKAKKVFGVVDSSTIRGRILAVNNNNPTVGEIVNYISTGTGFDRTVNSVSEFGTEITTKFNGSDSPVTLTKSDIDVTTMATEIAGAKEALAAIRVSEAEAKSKVSAAIKILDESKKKALAAAKEAGKHNDSAGKEANRNSAANINTEIRIANFMASMASKVTSVVINNELRKYRQYSRICREIYSAKGAEKDNGDKSENKATGESAIDFAMRYLG